MAGRAVGADGGCQGEAPVLVEVGDVAAEGAEGSAHQLDIQFIAIFGRLAGDDVDRSAHRVGSVQDGGGAARYFHTGCMSGQVFVGDGVTVDGLELRMAVDQDGDTAVRCAETTQGDGTGRTVGDTVSRDSAGRDEQTRDLIHQGRHHGILVTGCDRLSSHDTDRSGDLVPECRDARPGDHGAAEGIGRRDTPGGGGFIPCVQDGT